MKLSAGRPFPSLPFQPFSHMVSADSHCLSLCVSVPPTHVLDSLYSILSSLPSCFSSLFSFCCFDLLDPCSLHTCSLKVFCTGSPLPTGSVHLFQSLPFLILVHLSDLGATSFETEDIVESLTENGLALQFGEMVRVIAFYLL